MGLASGFAVLLLFVLHSAAFGRLTELTLLSQALETHGAACLDGSPAGYYHRKGEGNGGKKWIVHLEGGGWCYDEEDCLGRSKTDLGSSKGWPKFDDFDHGVLSDKKDINPDFYQWNSVFVPYCDGISFTGNRLEPITVDGEKLYFRGFRILTAIIENLLDIGMNDADEVILSGCSAGGLAVLYLLDYVRSLVPRSIPLSGLSDAGYFIIARNIDGQYPPWQTNAEYASKMHNTTSGENQECVKDHNASVCLLSQFAYPYVSTPLFSLNSQYDTWQLSNTLQVNCQPPQCDSEQMKAIQNFRKEFLEAAQQIIHSELNGAFLDSCFVHCQSRDDKSWAEVQVNRKTAAETFGEWYFKRGNQTKQVDCAYPCNDSC